MSWRPLKLLAGSADSKADEALGSGDRCLPSPPKSGSVTRSASSLEMKVDLRRSDYLKWRGFEEEFRDFQKFNPNLLAKHSGIYNTWMIRQLPAGEKDRFYSLMGLVATTTGHRGGGDPVKYLLDLIKQHLLQTESQLIVTAEEASRPKPTSALEEAQVQYGQIHTIRPLAQAVADHCLERAEQALNREADRDQALRAFPKWQASRWDEVELRFLSDHRIEVRIANEIVAASLNYTEMGFQDRRSGNPNSSWEILRNLAERHGVIPDTARLTGEWAAAEKRIGRTRDTLRKRFGLLDDPLPFEKGKGYQTRFRIGCAASFER